jgi:hypothetical protein
LCGEVSFRCLPRCVQQGSPELQAL